MATSLSLHIGVNKVDPSHYGSEAPLRGCENDARDMQAIATSVGYQTGILLTNDALSTTFLDYVSTAAKSLVPGDTFLLTLACHGSQIDDATGDEDDGKDETWCLYDRMIIDDEVYAAFNKFSEGVRIFVVSDSCHSGTSTRALLAAIEENQNFSRSLNLPLGAGFRCIDPFLDRSFFTRHMQQYASIKKAASREGSRSLNGGPDVVLISGCQDNQTSADDVANGFFTNHLKLVWNGGAFQGDFHAFKQKISTSMDTQTQVPNLFGYGQTVQEFMRERPFAMSKSNLRPSRVSKRGAAKGKGRSTSMEDREGELHMIHPSVFEMMRSNKDSQGKPRDLNVLPFTADRDAEGGCYVKWSRALFAGKSDAEVFRLFVDVVAPEMCGNYFTARDAFSGRAPRGGSVSCSANTSGEVSCTGTYSF